MRKLRPKVTGQLVVDLHTHGLLISPVRTTGWLGGRNGVTFVTSIIQYLFGNREVAVSWGDMMRAISGAVGMEGDGKDSRRERNETWW